ncbi:hypothetical protein KFK09_005508 [Dendrobium nobile]|uniref:Uncharacterized protein n=1 Tax=Dendrobium nobile TaxID=94219 RepID=A0A8T3BZD8_DENNO|nr:hypothetical protein KFK09_005508 [Dendrobium nobile]
MAVERREARSSERGLNSESFEFNPLISAVKICSSLLLLYLSKVRLRALDRGIKRDLAA